MPRTKVSVSDDIITIQTALPFLTYLDSKMTVSKDRGKATMQAIDNLMEWPKATNIPIARADNDWIVSLRGYPNAWESIVVHLMEIR